MPPTAFKNIKYGRNNYLRSKPAKSDVDEDIMRPPSYSSSSDEDNSANIKPAIFSSSYKREETRTRQDKVRRTARKASSQTTSGYNGVNSYRLRRERSSSSQNAKLNAVKPVDDGELPELHGEVFGNSFGNKFPGRKIQRAVYGRSSQSSSQSTAYSQPNSSQTSQFSPKKRLKCIRLPSSDTEDSENHSSAAFKPPSNEFLDLDDSESKSPTKAFKTPACSSCNSSPISKRKTPGDSTTANFKNDSPLPKFKIPKKFSETPSSSLGDPYNSFGALTQKSANETDGDNEEIIFKARSDFNYDHESSVSSNAVALSPFKKCLDFETDETTMSHCPMCYEPVSSDDLRNQGYMNTRRQEQFCLEHRKKSARKRWEINRYPNIDWVNLDTRVSKHHNFLRNLINGKESYYRTLLQDNIDKGKDRNLRTATTNLIPGYYGPRGLRIISENLFRKFTPLLKKRIVQDRLIAARGYTPYVQSVLVPEVAALLIQEDLLITLSEARCVMNESAVIGELLHEEVREDFMMHSQHKKFNFEES